ncbi:MAG TPA: LON peptidase substrate-binding domain-containing protein [Gemmataceae bacterium]
MNEDPNALKSFGGTARLFPLPSLVMFPHALQPLHVFEPRYRRMTADTLAADRLIAPVLLKPGWEKDYDDRPAVEKVACLGRVVAHHQLPDGRYNLLVRGLSRVRLVEEIDSAKPYRTARVELLPDVPPPVTPQLGEWRRRLSELVLPRLSGSEPARGQLRQLFHSDLPLGALCDILAFALPLPLDCKQALLEEPDVRARVYLLLDRLRPRKARAFPPGFSPN